MDNETLILLQKLGTLLDQDIFPDVKNGGIVTLPSHPVPFLFNMGKEKNDEHFSRRSEAGSRQGPPGWEGPPGRSRPSYTPVSAVSPGLRSFYEQDLNDVCAAYPENRYWQYKDGLWLLTRSQLLENSCFSVTFLTGVSFSWPTVAKGWAFWDGAIWVGPRHTNFDGSICAFEPADETWRIGESLVPLLDLYTVWALRQLFLKTLGYWPGRQSAHFVYERLTETLDFELCGCGSNVKYVDCCKTTDLHRNTLAGAVRWNLRRRGPPSSIVSSVSGRTDPPPIALMQR